MKTVKLLLVICVMFLYLETLKSQDLNDTQGNSLQAMIDSDDDDKLTLGAYAQIDYNHRFRDSLRYNGMMEVHRLVTFMGYRFSKSTMFVTEIEYEHVNELYVEQAYVNHKILPWLHLRGGLLLIPMGLINEYHEPPTYNGVERPTIDNVIVPTTWREMGAGFAGKFDKASIRYQLYLVNGPLSYKNGVGLLQGSNVLRNGRQKGIKNVFTSANIAAKAEYYGIDNLNLGLSAYAGKSQSTAFHNLKDEDRSYADSTIVNIQMYALDARYMMNGIELKGQFVVGSFGNTDAYNALTGKDLGSMVYGFYTEISYDVLSKSKHQLKPFFRFEKFDTHYKTANSISKNESFNRHELFAGLSWHPVQGVAFKADLQLTKNKTFDSYSKIINAGIGVWF